MQETERLSFAGPNSLGTRGARSDGVIGAIRSQLLHELVVQPENQKRRRPLTNEQSDVSIALYLPFRPRSFVK
jgi:hypothetical protein